MTAAALPNSASFRTAPGASTPASNDRLRPLKVQPLRALRAFRKLLANKEDTVQVFEIMQALNGKSTAKAYRRLIATASGGRLAYERTEMADVLSDHALVDSFAADTVGGHYRQFVRSQGFTPEGLAAESRKARGSTHDLQHPYAWFGRRVRDTHDIWHILTGYDRDGLGELCLVAFSFAQTRSLGWAFIAVGGVLQGFRLKQGRRTAAIVWQAYRNGKNAAWLPGQDFVALLNEPLSVARQRLNIAAPTFYDTVPAALRNGAMSPAVKG